MVIRTRRLFRMIWKEMVHLKRDRVSLTMMIALPVVQLTLFGYAINTEVKNLSLVVIDPNPSSDSRYIVESFVNTGYFRFAGYINCYDELRLLLDENKVRAGLVFPPDFKSRFRANKSVSVQLIVDATDPLASRSAIATARALGLHHSLRMKMGESIAGFEMPLDIRVRGWYNPDMRSADFMVPGLIGVIIQLITVLVTALSVVREREFGTMEQLLASPLRRWEIVVGKLTPPLITTYIIITISLLLAYFVFGVAIEGNIILLYFLTFPFLLVALGIGIFISTIAKNQLQAMQMSFFFFLPSIMLSGFIFPIDAMPNVIRQICYAIPLTYFLNIIRGIIVKGVGLYELRLDTLVLLTMGVLVITLSIMRMGKRLG
ncbi:MAG: ABC transporter permease [Candidatus Coatesbacteria bacterium]|nr:MAG: ABC transporter permease [Candidatus Coatesbacteria bacterium]